MEDIRRGMGILFNICGYTMLLHVRVVIFGKRILIKVEHEES